MTILILEVCRSPEIKKQTEAIILERYFSQKGINFEVYSNDEIWQPKTILTKKNLRKLLKKPNIKIIHLAMHGDASGLCLRWSTEELIRKRFPEEILTCSEITLMKEWQGKIIVSGACYSSTIANAFLEAGASCIIAPRTAIPWKNLGSFFSVFYEKLFEGNTIKFALESAIVQFPEYQSYRAYLASGFNFQWQSPNPTN